MQREKTKQCIEHTRILNSNEVLTILQIKIELFFKIKKIRSYKFLKAKLIKG